MTTPSMCSGGSPRPFGPGAGPLRQVECSACGDVKILTHDAAGKLSEPFPAHAPRSPMSRATKIAPTPAKPGARPAAPPAPRPAPPARLAPVTKAAPPQRPAGPPPAPPPPSFKKTLAEALAAPPPPLGGAFTSGERPFKRLLAEGLAAQEAERR